MNCKPGDLAVIVSTNGEKDQWPLGRIVICQSHIRVAHCDYWRLGELLPVPGAPGFFVDAVQDSCLCPLRDPGDDAVDETLLWLPVPETEAA